MEKNHTTNKDKDSRRKGEKKAEVPEIKSILHERNKHRGLYDFNWLICNYPELEPFVAENEYGNESIDFFDPEAVKMLNRALLKTYYNISYWDIPDKYLCPPIPGRADYIHYLADLLSESFGEIPTGKDIRGLDIGVGSSCIYPILGQREYEWSFVGSDIDEVSISSAKEIVEKNALLDSIEIRLQRNLQDLFFGIIKKNERFHFTMCNPPFHASKFQAEAMAMRKLSNLKGGKVDKPVLNFGGQGKELWCNGGELKFITQMVRQSQKFQKSCLWFTTLVSKESNSKIIQDLLKSINVPELKVIQMGQGNKRSRIVAWSFIPMELHKNWGNEKPKNQATDTSI